jgi:hypothetical protein
MGALRIIAAFLMLIVLGTPKDHIEFFPACWVVCFSKGFYFLFNIGALLAFPVLLFFARGGTDIIVS